MTVVFNDDRPNRLRRRVVLSRPDADANASTWNPHESDCRHLPDRPASRRNNVRQHRDAGNGQRNGDHDGGKRCLRAEETRVGQHSMAPFRRTDSSPPMRFLARTHPGRPSRNGSEGKFTTTGFTGRLDVNIQAA